VKTLSLPTLVVPVFCEEVLTKRGTGREKKSPRALRPGSGRTAKRSNYQLRYPVRAEASRSMNGFFLTTTEFAEIGEFF
jgi:hypothetical protein